MSDKFKLPNDCFLPSEASFKYMCPSVKHAVTVYIVTVYLLVFHENQTDKLKKLLNIEIDKTMIIALI